MAGRRADARGGRIKHGEDTGRKLPACKQVGEEVVVVSDDVGVGARRVVEGCGAQLGRERGVLVLKQRGEHLRRNRQLVRDMTHPGRDEGVGIVVSRLLVDCVDGPERVADRHDAPECVADVVLTCAKLCNDLVDGRGCLVKRQQVAILGACALAGAELVDCEHGVLTLGHVARERVLVPVDGGHGPILVVVCGPVDRDQQRPVAEAALVVEVADDLGGAAVG